MGAESGCGVPAIFFELFVLAERVCTDAAVICPPGGHRGGRGRGCVGANPKGSSAWGPDCPDRRAFPAAEAGKGARAASDEGTVSGEPGCASGFPAFVGLGVPCDAGACLRSPEYLKPGTATTAENKIPSSTPRTNRRRIAARKPSR